MNVVAIVQARTGSTRLPGKVMYPLRGVPAVTRVASRAERAEQVDRVVVATTDARRDDVIERAATRLGVDTFRGAEDDVLGRTTAAAREVGADVIVRIAGDCPLVSPRVVDATVARLEEAKADYAANKIDRSFPLGLDVEAVSAASLERVSDLASAACDREHVTTYYRSHPDQFALANLPSEAVFEEPRFRGRTDLRVVLDEAADYALLSRVYDDLGDDPTVPVVIDHIDAHDFGRLNAHLDRPNEDSEAGREANVGTTRTEEADRTDGERRVDAERQTDAEGRTGADGGHSD